MEKIALQSERLPPPDGPFSHGVKVGNLDIHCMCHA